MEGGRLPNIHMINVRSKFNEGVHNVYVAPTSGLVQR